MGHLGPEMSSQCYQRQVRAWPHLIYCNLTQNPSYSIPGWVDDLVSSLVTAVFQTSKSCDFLILIYLGISWDQDFQLTLLMKAWPHLICSNLTQNPPYSIPRWVDDLTSSFVTAVSRLQNPMIFWSGYILGYPGTRISSWHYRWKLDRI